jgi:lipid A 4'-phosphatase
MRGRWDVAALIVALAFFALFPRLDLTITHWVYDPVGGFFLRDRWWIQLIYHGTEVFVALLALSTLTALSVAALQRGTWARRNARAAGFLLLAFVCGPGLVVNGIFKSHWGRAKPASVQQFGGDWRYTAPLVPADQCTRNCSFVSGHASIGFALFAFGWLLPRRRRSWFALAGVCGAIIGAVRIAQGGHFFSDVIFSGFAVWFSTLALHAVWLRNHIPGRYAAKALATLLPGPRPIPAPVEPVVTAHVQPAE